MEQGSRARWYLDKENSVEALEAKQGVQSIVLKMALKASTTRDLGGASL